MLVQFCLSLGSLPHSMVARWNAEQKKKPNAAGQALFWEKFSLHNVGLYKMAYVYMCELGQNILE